MKRVGEQTFDIVREFVDEIVTLPDEQIFEAVVWTMHYAKLVPEGAAAAPVAALLQGLVKAPRRIEGRAACCRGGNVNLDQLKGCAGTDARNRQRQVLTPGVSPATPGVNRCRSNE